MTKPVEKKAIKKFDGAAECLFCHQTAIISGTPKSKKEADKLVTLNCKCVEAKSYQEKEDRRKKRAENERKLKACLDDIAQHAIKRNVEISEPAKQAIATAGILVIEQLIDSIAVKISRTKIAISTNSKGNIILSSTYSDGTKVEL